MLFGKSATIRRTASRGAGASQQSGDPGKLNPPPSSPSLIAWYYGTEKYKGGPIQGIPYTSHTPYRCRFST